MQGALTTRQLDLLPTTKGDLEFMPARTTAGALSERPGGVPRLRRRPSVGRCRGCWGTINGNRRGCEVEESSRGGSGGEKGRPGNEARSVDPRPTPTDPLAE